MADEFSASIRTFIDQNVESVAQLEALLLMRRDPQRSWDAAEIAKALYIPPTQAGMLLGEFSSRGFVKPIAASNQRYSFGPSNAQIEEVITEIAQAHHDRPVALISLIYSKPLNKVQTFADAFRLRKETPP